MKPLVAGVVCLMLSGCGAKPEPGQLHVAAAANLQRILGPLAKAFEKQSGVKVIPSYGASTQLAQQIQNGAPFDVFLSADIEQVDKLVNSGLISASTRAVYARGVLAIWAPRREDIRKAEDLKRVDVKHIGIANPDVAPYGKASIETLTALNLWPELKPKMVYAPNISMAAAFSESGNADAAFTALSLVNDRLEKPIVVPEELHKPIEQALGIITSTPHGEAAAEFRSFILGKEARAIFTKFGYLGPE